MIDQYHPDRNGQISWNMQDRKNDLFSIKILSLCLFLLCFFLYIWVYNFLSDSEIAEYILFIQESFYIYLWRWLDPVWWDDPRFCLAEASRWCRRDLRLHQLSIYAWALLSSWTGGLFWCDGMACGQCWISIRNIIVVCEREEHKSPSDHVDWLSSISKPGQEIRCLLFLRSHSELWLLWFNVHISCILFQEVRVIDAEVQDHSGISQDILIW